ncbi:hypothetical protein MOXK02_17860 [Moraxella sp. K02]
MAVIGQAEILLTANTASFTTEMDRARSVSQRTARQIERDQQQQAQSRLQIERQYASEHRRIEMALTDEVERIRAARFNTADEQRYIAQARANAQQQVDLIAQQERATTGFADKAKTAYGYVAIAVGVASVAIGALIKNQIEMTAELTKTAYIANTTVENIQKYVVAAKGMGIETDKLGDIFKDTQDKVGDFLTTGGGEMADFFENIAPQVKVTADQFRNLSGPDALQLYFDSLQKANLSQSEMIFYMESVADEASALIPYLKDGGKGFDLWATAAENAGATMDEKTIRATQELKTSTELLNLSVQGAKNQIAQAFMPVLRDLAVELVKDAKLKEQAAKAGQGMADGFKLIANTGIAAVSIIGIMIDGVRGLHTAFSELGKITDGVDFKSPFATLQLAKNAFFTPVRMGADVAFTAVQIQQRIDATNGLMEKVNKLGTNPTGSNLVSTLTNLNIQSEKLKNATGKTGKALKEETEAKKENAKATAKLASEQARLVGISGNSGIGSGAHLDIRASGGGRRLTSAELARFQADGKPLTAYRKTSDYGYRGDIGVAGASKYHRGIDFAMPVGTPITTKVPVKNVSNFYDPKGGGYVQRVLFADGLSVDLLHQSPASKGIKGGSSGIKSPYTKAQDETSQLIAQQQDVLAREAKNLADNQVREAERAAKEQKDLQMKYVTEFADEKTKLYLEHTAKETEISKINDIALREQLLKTENVRYQNKVDLLQLESDKQTQKATEWQQSEEERIIANAELERREAALTLTNDVNLRQAKIDAINAQEQESLRQLRIGFETELAGITDYSKTELQRLRDDYQNNLRGIDGNNKYSDAQKSDLRNALAGKFNSDLAIIRQPAADAFNGLNTEMSGTSELQNLQNQFNQRLEIIKKAKDAEVIATEQAERAKAKAEQNYWYASYQLQATQSANIIDSVANMGKIMFGETSSSYKRLFALSQSFVMAQAGLNMYKAISDGWAHGATLPQKLAAASVAGAEMLKIITAAQQIKMQGFMDGGYTGNIPTNARAGYVHGQEYVFDAPSTKAIGVKNLDRIRKGEGIGGDTNVNVNVTVNSDGTSSVESQQQLGKNIGDAVNAAIQKALLKERRQGGMLSGAR